MRNNKKVGSGVPAKKENVDYKVVSEGLSRKLKSVQEELKIEKGKSFLVSKMGEGKIVYVTDDEQAREELRQSKEVQQIQAKSIGELKMFLANAQKENDGRKKKLEFLGCDSIELTGDANHRPPGAHAVIPLDIHFDMQDKIRQFEKDNDNLVIANKKLRDEMEEVRSDSPLGWAKTNGELVSDIERLKKERDDFAKKLCDSEFSGHIREDVHQSDSKEFAEEIERLKKENHLLHQRYLHGYCSRGSRPCLIAEKCKGRAREIQMIKNCPDIWKQKVMEKDAVIERIQEEMRKLKGLAPLLSNEEIEKFYKDKIEKKDREMVDVHNIKDYYFKMWQEALGKTKRLRHEILEIEKRGEDFYEKQFESKLEELEKEVDGVLAKNLKLEEDVDDAEHAINIYVNELHVLRDRNEELEKIAFPWICVPKNPTSYINKDEKIKELEEEVEKLCSELSKGHHSYDSAISNIEELNAKIKELEEHRDEMSKLATPADHVKADRDMYEDAYVRSARHYTELKKEYDELETMYNSEMREKHIKNKYFIENVQSCLFGAWVPIVIKVRDTGAMVYAESLNPAMPYTINIDGKPTAQFASKRQRVRFERLIKKKWPHAKLELGNIKKARGI